MTKTLRLGGIRFTTSVEIAPEKAPNGRVRAHMPQSRYQKADAKPLNRRGAGPFCRFMTAGQAGLPQAPGVYVLTVDGAPTYVGKANNLAQRWGTQETPLPQHGSKTVVSFRSLDAARFVPGCQCRQTSSAGDG